MPAFGIAGRKGTCSGRKTTLGSRLGRGIHRAAGSPSCPAEFPRRDARLLPEPPTALRGTLRVGLSRNPSIRIGASPNGAARIEPGAVRQAVCQPPQASCAVGPWLRVNFVRFPGSHPMLATSASQFCRAPEVTCTGLCREESGLRAARLQGRRIFWRWSRRALTPCKRQRAEGSPSPGQTDFLEPACPHAVACCLPKKSD
jgi:hypothetical protein